MAARVVLSNAQCAENILHHVIVATRSCFVSCFFILFLEIIISIHGSHAVRCRLSDLDISTEPLFLLQAKNLYAGSGMSTFLSRRRLRLCCEVPSGRCETPCFHFIVSVAASGMLFALLCERGAVVSATRSEGVSQGETLSPQTRVRTCPWFFLLACSVADMFLIPNLAHSAHECPAWRRHSQGRAPHW